MKLPPLRRGNCYLDKRRAVDYDEGKIDLAPTLMLRDDYQPD